MHATFPEPQLSTSYHKWRSPLQLLAGMLPNVAAKLSQNHLIDAKFPYFHYSNKGISRETGNSTLHIVTACLPFVQRPTHWRPTRGWEVRFACFRWDDRRSPKVWCGRNSRPRTQLRRVSALTHVNNPRYIGSSHRRIHVRPSALCSGPVSPMWTCVSLSDTSAPLSRP